MSISIRGVHMNFKKIPNVIAISGPQGSGKGTLMSAVEKRHFDSGMKTFYFDDFKVSRSVQQQLGITRLVEIEDDFNKMCKFQTMVLTQKVQSLNELKYFHNDAMDFIITERSFIDIASYFQLWCMKQFNKGTISETQYFETVDVFSEMCYEAQHELIKMNVIVPMMDHIRFEVDPHRASEADLDDFYEIFMNHVVNTTTEYRFITAETIAARTDEFFNFFKD